MEYTNMSEVDVAYHILSEAGETKNYRDLILDIIRKKRKPVQSLSAAISEVYTLINMDSRFSYEGDNQWGLTEWRPPEVKRSHGSRGGTKSKAAKPNARSKKLERIQE